MGPIRDAFERSDERYRDQRPAVSTYRYLRIGMVLTVMAIGVAIILERAEVDCWQTSISAYYYTPVKVIFVGGMIAIGASLIAIKGRNLFEDTCLNIAGMLAPLVAAIPTEAVAVDRRGKPACAASATDAATTAIRDSGSAHGIPDWLRSSIDNNVNTLLIVGAIALAVVVVLSVLRARRGESAAGPNPWALGLAAAVAVLVLVSIAVAHWKWDAFYTRAHGVVAVVMFVFLGLAVAGNAVTQLRRRPRTPLAWIYLGTFVWMLVLGVIFQFVVSWDYHVFIVEGIEIAAFVVFWVTQTRQYWNDDIAVLNAAP